MRFSGKVGYVIPVERVIEGYEDQHSGIFDEIINEKKYSGDVLRDYSSWNNSSQINGSPILHNDISIIADQFAYQNFQWIRYIHYMNADWAVTSIEVQRPRLLLKIGGLYNATDQQTDGTPEATDENNW